MCITDGQLFVFVSKDEAKQTGQTCKHEIVGRKGKKIGWHKALTPLETNVTLENHHF